MTKFRTIRQRIASFFFSVGNAIQYYEPLDPTPYGKGVWSNVSIFFEVASNEDYDVTTTKIFDDAADILGTREWGGGSNLEFDEDME